MRGARPSGWRLTRSVLTGGSSRSRGDAVGEDARAEPLARHQVPPAVDDDGREGLVAPRGGWSRASRTGAISSASSDVAG